jgi:biotin transporter BioY
VSGDKITRNQTVGWTIFGAGVLVYFLAIAYLTNPHNRFPDWVGHLIVFPPAVALIGFVQGMTGKSPREFYRHQRTLKGWKQTLLNVFILLFVGFLAMNLIVVFVRHHNVAD